MNLQTITLSLLAFFQSDALQLRKSLAFESQGVVEYQRARVDLVIVCFVFRRLVGYDRFLLVQSNVCVLVVIVVAMPVDVFIFN